MSEIVKIALIGLGTVGTGVARVLLEESERLTRRCGKQIKLAKVVVRDKSRPRHIDLPDEMVTDNLQDVLDDESIQIAVQLIGGINPAKDYMERLLDSGKHVVSANKALLCEHGEELFSRAREQGRTIAFEAAVAGGVPIIHVLSQAMVGNQITSIEAILNGTSNFILSEMFLGGRDYADVLREAQELGYAEADPALDVDGTDAAQKLGLLTQLAFGTKVSLDQFPRQGIDKLPLEDLLYADELGYSVRLIAVARLLNEQLEMHVQPTLVQLDKPLAQVSGVNNMVALEGDVVGKTWYSGYGAGQNPTASAVIADLVDTVAGRSDLIFPFMDLWSDRPARKVLPAEEIRRRYYMRFSVLDQPHTFAEMADILGRNQISLASIIQHETPESPEANGESRQIVPVVIMTHMTTEGRIRAASAELAELKSICPDPVIMPVLD
ncbi:Homoserine dehydrogenase [Polystyrenella longa]|uniref:Homoserine dehydrogenase n=1 Tax=Polystyrenella longa TaxID=2528007 RepID=A0A518CHM2_9PLAN|nr:homoserine dehydrogenase [Polystyrenella longa]QDU78725.1 Homoserine dehydrogenase [Polystyrenella longa]